MYFVIIIIIIISVSVIIIIIIITIIWGHCHDTWNIIVETYCLITSLGIVTLNLPKYYIKLQLAIKTTYKMSLYIIHTLITQKGKSILILSFYYDNFIQ